MDQVVLAQKLESLRRCIQRIEQKRPDAPQAFEQDPDLQDVIVLNLTRAVQICVDIASHIISRSNERPPSTMGEAFAALHAMGIIDSETSDHMQKSVGFRNIAVHNYETINWQIVFHICHDRLRDFQTFARKVADTAGL